MNLMKSLKDAFLKHDTGNVSPTSPEAKSSVSSTAVSFSENLEAKRIHERNAAFLRGLSSSGIEKNESFEAEKEVKSVSDRKVKLLEVLKNQDALLDNILKEQNRLHKDVKKRNWDDLQNTLERLRNMSDIFVNLDSERENLVGTERTLYFEDKIEGVFSSLRSKLTKSKIENEALRSYVTTTKDFISNVLEECYEKESSSYSSYSSDGSKIKGDVGSMLVNTEF